MATFAFGPVPEEATLLGKRRKVNSSSPSTTPKPAASKARNQRCGTASEDRCTPAGYICRFRFASPKSKSGRGGHAHRRRLDALIATLQHGLSNALVEATNTRIRLLTRRAYGFHSAEPLIAL